MKNKLGSTFWVSLVLFLIAPILSLPTIIFGIYRREKGMYFLLSLFLALIAFLMPPTGDLNRYHAIFEFTQDAKNLPQLFFLMQESGFDFFIYIASFGFGKIGLSVEFVRALYSFIGTTLFFMIHKEICERNSIFSKNRMLSFLFLLCILILCNNGKTFTYRWFLSVIAFIYGVFSLDITKKKGGLFWIVFSVLNHWAILPAIAVYVIQRVIPINLKRPVLVFFLILIVTQAMSFVLSYIPGLNVGDEELQQKLLGYSEGYWANEFLQDRSFKGMIFLQIGRLPFYLGFIYLILEDQRRKPLKSFNHSMAALTTLLSGSYTLTSRYGSFVTYGAFIAFFLNFSAKWMNYLKIILLASMIVFASNVYSGRRAYQYGYSSKIFTSSLYSILNTRYTESWINNNLSQDGNEYIKK